MATKLKGPGIFLAQFAGDEAPFNSLPAIAEWAAGLGYKGIQLPSWDQRLFDLEKAASSETYCDEIKGICADAGVVITELSTHLQGQLVAVNPAYDVPFDAFARSRYAAIRQHGKPGRWNRYIWPGMLRAGWGWMSPSHSPAHWPSLTSIPGRNARPA
ncbi:MAG: hypothetical protein R3E89_09440 [Thiolinea sp.]